MATRKYPKQTGKSVLSRDKVRKAKLPGMRTVTGTKRKYYEARRNRSDAKGKRV